MGSSNLPGPVPDEAIEFLKRWDNQGSWVLTALRSDRKKGEKKNQETITVYSAEPKGVRDFIEEWNVRKHWNVYFTVNSCGGQEIKLKPSRTDIAALTWLHVDLDPRPGEDIAEEQKRILNHLKNPPGGIPAPTCITFSGGGYQAYWKLSRPVLLDGTEEMYEDAKLYNKRLEQLLEADNCHNVDRIMRLPGTVNWPDARKRNKGRVPALASLVEWSDHERVYDLDQFEKAEATPARVNGNAEVEIDLGNVRPIQNLDTELPSSVPPVVKRVIACGEDPENGEPHRMGWSRSEWQWWATCELARQKVEPEVIYSILLDPGWSISDSVRDKGSGADSYARRQVERAMEEAEDDPLLAEINSRHASVIVGGSSRVLRESWDPLFERRTVEYLKKDAFKDFWNTRRVEVPVATGKVQEMPAGEWWFRHRLRRSYEDVNYAPGKELPEGVYNLWQGFAVSPAEGDCGLYLAHVRDNICGGVEEHFKYLIRWMAYAVQHPNDPGHVALVMRGEKGTGKGVFTGHFGALWGRHFVQITNPDHLTKFNSLIEQASVVFLDEATRPKDKKHEAILKGMVTEESVKVERKGIDVVNRQNVLHLILASNDLSVIKATGDERRYFVLDVSSTRRQDHAYFEAIDEQMRRGGYEALLKLLLEMDLSGFTVRRAPKTAALQDQVDRNLEPMDEWLLTLLLDGRLPNNVTRTVKGAPRAIPCRAWWGPSAESLEDGLRQHASETVPRLRDESDVALGKFLDDWGVTSPEKGGRRSRAFRPLSELRAAWCEKHGPRDWPRDGEWESVGDEDNEALG